MQRNILEYLENTVRNVPDKIAFTDSFESLTFKDVYEQARSVGSTLQKEAFYKEPVVVFMKKQPQTITAFLGVVYAGCYYVPLDEEMPAHRIEQILETLNSRVLICDNDTEKLIPNFNYQGKVLNYKKIAFKTISVIALNRIRSLQIDTDPVYIVFTSGSTGIPKGVLGCHRAVIDYIENLCDVLNFDENTIFGNQTPLYFDACLKEILPTLKYGATTNLIPGQLFLFPVKLIEYLNEHKVNTLCWVVSALTFISSLGTLKKCKPEYVRTIAFASEVFPMKQFHLWQQALPDTRFINLYGPTETTGICCYYEVNRTFSENETLPVGKPFQNTEILLLNENNEKAAPGEQGEICIRGTRLTHGYYRNPERTHEVFVQNPLNTLYPEMIYRTGDIGK